MREFFPDQKEELVYDIFSSPLGELVLMASSKGLHRVSFGTDIESGAFSRGLENMVRQAEQPFIRQAKQELAEYFAGQRKEFGLPLHFSGTTFQKQAWGELCKIPYGQTISYQEQARRLGDIKKCRAAGMANNRNKIAIIVPCHRVIGKSGQLTGYGGGMERKRYLLDLESR
jgi:methylated-DNA-[protein]-cysteine S-methyltransferase